MSKLAPVTLAVVLGLLAAACGGADDASAPVTASTTNPEASDAAEDDASEECHNPELGYTVSHPADWHTNPGDVLEPCRVFDPEPIELEEGTEIPFSLAVSVSVAQPPIEQMRELLRDDRGLEVRSIEETEVDGRPALRVDAVGTGAALLPEGMRRLAYLVDGGERTLVFATYDAGDLAFETKRDALETIVESLR